VTFHKFMKRNFGQDLTDNVLQVQFDWQVEYLETTCVCVCQLLISAVYLCMQDPCPCMALYHHFTYYFNCWYVYYLYMRRWWTAGRQQVSVLQDTWNSQQSPARSESCSFHRLSSSDPTVHSVCIYFTLCYLLTVSFVDTLIVRTYLLTV